MYFISCRSSMQCMHCMQSACRAVKIELKPGLILMRVPDAPQSALIIRMFLQSPLTALHASCMHCMQTCQDCVCCLKSKSLSDMCLPDPYPMQGFFMKRRKYLFTVTYSKKMKWFLPLTLDNNVRVPTCSNVKVPK